MSEDTNVQEEVTQETVTEEAKEETKPKSSGSSFYKQKLAEIQAENQKLAELLEQEKTQKLQEKENFKELWELEKNKRVEAENKAKKITDSYFNGLKRAAIEQEALKAGILDAALSDITMLDHNMVEIETTSSGNVNVLGAKEFVENLKEQKTHWFKRTGVPNINNANPAEPKTKELTADELVKLQKTNPEKYREEMKRKFSIA